MIGKKLKATIEGKKVEGICKFIRYNVDGSVCAYCVRFEGATWEIFPSELES